MITNILRTAIFCFASVVTGLSQAARIDLIFDVRLDRIYSYDAKHLEGILIGDVLPMFITFDSEVGQTYAETDPWGPGTARLYSSLVGPVFVDSPYSSFIPSNPFQPVQPNSFSANGVTANERQGSNVWYEDLWFSNQYDQIEPVQADGAYAYRRKFNLHWNKTNFDYTPGDLYFFTSEDVLRVLDQSLLGTTFNLTDDAYIQFADGNAAGFELFGTATLREYRVIEVAEPGSFITVLLGILVLCFVQRRRNKESSLIALNGKT